MSGEVAELDREVAGSPEGWRQVVLSDVADVNPEALRASTPPDYAFGYIDISQIEGPGQCPGWTRQTFGNAPSRARRKVQAGDILVSTVRPYLRSFAQVPEADLPLVASTGFAVVRAGAHADQQFLYQHILHSSFLAHLTPRMTGSNYPAVSAGDVEVYPISLPPLDEQRRIAEVLRSMDEAIAAAESVAEASQGVHRLSLEALFGICFSDAHREGENSVTIRQVCERVTYGFTNPMPTTHQGPWMLTAANVRHGWIDYHSARHTSVSAYTNDISEKSRPPVGAVLVTKDGTLGRIARVDRADVCINQSVAALTPDATVIDGSFLSFLLQCQTGQDRMLADSGGSSVKHIYISKLADLPFALPPLDVQRERALFAEECERAVQHQTRTAAGLRALKAHVSSDLLCGHVRVPA